MVISEHLGFGVLELLHPASGHVELLLKHGRLSVQLTNFAVQFKARVPIAIKLSLAFVKLPLQRSNLLVRLARQSLLVEQLLL